MWRILINLNTITGGFSLPNGSGLPVTYISNSVDGGSINKGGSVLDGSGMFIKEQEGHRFLHKD